jgi:hypothetical protein
VGFLFSIFLVSNRISSARLSSAKESHGKDGVTIPNVRTDLSTIHTPAGSGRSVIPPSLVNSSIFGLEYPLNPMSTQITLCESKAFKVECTLLDGEKSLLCQPKGEITEVADLNPLQAYIADLRGKLQVIRFDLESVSRINSYGVRNWLIFLRAIPPNFRTEFERVSEALWTRPC